MHAQGGLPIPDIVHIPQPYWFERGRPAGVRAEDFGLRSRPAGSKQKILELGPDKVAAFIGEPIQGAGGVIIPPATYWPEIQRICDATASCWSRTRSSAASAAPASGSAARPSASGPT